MTFVGEIIEGRKLSGGTAYRQHQSLKEFIRERDNHTCQLCGQFGEVVDHIVPWRVSHDSSLANLRVLCRQCNLATRRKPQHPNVFRVAEDWYNYLEQELAKYQMS